MYYREHNPPHFHVRYGEYEAQFDLQEELFSVDFFHQNKPD